MSILLVGLAVGVAAAAFLSGARSRTQSCITYAQDKE